MANYITEDDIEVSLINILKSDELNYDFIQCDPNPNLKEQPDRPNATIKLYKTTCPFLLIFFFCILFTYSLENVLILPYFKELVKLKRTNY